MEPLGACENVIVGILALVMLVAATMLVGLSIIGIAWLFGM